MIADVIIELQGQRSSERYPQRLRMIIFIDPDTGRRIVFITNNFKLAASTIAAIYKARWQIENFFKWIKKTSRSKAFGGPAKTRC
ncbi:MAG: transposase [Deltaproteobacteria bacterium]|nr:transposase [Deltaproteobacteria bacterium]MBW2092993.1 transposase [Deltaproteobacteria bacterium]